MPDVVTILLYVAGAIALVFIVSWLAAPVVEARARKARGDRPLGEERLKAYAAMVGVGMPPAAADAALSPIGPGPAAPSAPPPPRPSAGVPPAPRPSAGVPPAPPSSSKATVPPVGPFPDPHLLERIRALEAKVAALEAQVGAPAEADLAGMRAPRPERAPQDAPRPPGLRAFP